jgi:hypothetical protein
MVIEILTEVSHLHKSGKSVVFCWVRGHTGLPGNEVADAAAKTATLHGFIIFDTALGSDVHTFLHRALLSSWQDEWSDIQGDKLCMVKPSMQSWYSSFSAMRNEAVMLSHLRIGHTWCFAAQ